MLQILAFESVLEWISDGLEKIYEEIFMCSEMFECVGKHNKNILFIVL